MADSKPIQEIENLYIKFADLRRNTKLLMSSCEKRYLEAIQTNSQRHIKEFWAYTKTLRKTNSFPSQMIADGETLNNPEDMAEAFATYFNSVHSAIDPNLPNFTATASDSNSFSFKDVNESDILQRLKQVDANKGMGIDRISNYFIKAAANSLALPMTIIVNKIIRHGVYPSHWKIGNWTPIHKSGDTHDVKNYRGVAVLPGLNQIAEKLIHEQIFFHVKNQLNERQHGFTKQKSTLTNLLEYVQRLSTMIDKGEQIDVIYMDMAKAFDRVPHKRLIQKLSFFGLNRMSSNLIESYLKNRSYRVKFCGKTSASVYPTSGTDQGSVLGPLLFLLYVNDLFDGLTCEYQAYADDLKLFAKVHSPSDQLLIQNNLQYCDTWCTDNGLEMNEKKCVTLTVTKRQNPLKFVYTLKQSALQFIRSIRDLGVTIDDRLRFDEHIELTVRKANKMLGFLMRTCKPFDQLKTIMVLYNSLVRSQLEYCSSIWSPLYSCYDLKLESVQRRFTRYVYKKFNYPPEEYENRLRKLEMISLSDRRILSDVTNLNKIVNGTMKTKLIEELGFRANVRGLRHNSLFDLPVPRTNTGTSAPVYRMCLNFQNLPPDTDLFLPFNTFKKNVFKCFKN